MGLLDGLLGQLAGNVDIANLAAKVGLSQEQVEQAVTALGQAHTEPGDTAEVAADATGLPTDKLNEIIGHIGGEGSLARFSELLNEHGGVGGLLGGLSGGLAGELGGLFGKKD